LRFVAQLLINFTRVQKRLRMVILRAAFRRVGRNFVFDPDSVFSYRTIEVGDDVFVAQGAILQSPRSQIIIGNKVMFGPEVAVLGGNHNASVIGQYMYDVKEKRPDDDQPIVIEDDVWIGARATILKGVRLQRGSIVAAGAIVTKDVPAYTVVGGIPAKVLAVRFTIEQILQHEAGLYLEDKRLSPDALTAMLGQYY